MQLIHSIGVHSYRKSKDVVSKIEEIACTCINIIKWHNSD